MSAAPLRTWDEVRTAVAQRCPPRTPPAGAWNPMGVPCGLRAWIELLDQLGLGTGPYDIDRRDTGAVLESVALDMQLIEATGRWTLSRYPRRQPSSYVPGDVLALRCVYAHALLLEHSLEDPAPQRPEAGILVKHDGVPAARALQQAAAYWLPPGSEEAVLASEAPPAEQLAQVRLRHPITAVWLAHPAEIPGPLLTAGLADLQADVDLFATTELQAPQPVISAATVLDALAEDDHPGRLEGVVLFADDDGIPLDGIGWLVRVQPLIAALPDRGIVLGRRTHAGWRGVADLITAIVAWGDWKDPATISDLPQRPARADLRRLRQGSTRRLEEAGALAAVRVLDARRRPASAGHDEPTGTHASPIPHPRRGYWRNQPVGPRDEGRREPRWIPPTWVNADGARRRPARVYRLPPPPRSWRGDQPAQPGPTRPESDVVPRRHQH